MKASELIAELQKLIAEHGDLEMFTTADYDWVDLPHYDDCHWANNEKDRTPRFIMDSEFRPEAFE